MVVAFEQDIKDEDAEAIVNAIRMLKGIADVSTSVTNHDDFMNRAKIKWELRSKIMQLLVND